MKKALILIVLLASLILLGLSSCKSLSSTEYNIDKNACNGCTNCSAVCPSDAIYFDSHGKAVIDQSKCTKCGDCVAVCPQNAIY
jgi:ferredoxin